MRRPIRSLLRIVAASSAVHIDAMLPLTAPHLPAIAGIPSAPARAA